MKMYFFVSLLLSFALISPIFAGTEFAQEPVATIAAASGDIEFNQGGEQPAFKVVKFEDACNKQLSDRDIVRSYNGSTAEVQLNCGADIKLLAGVEMQIGIARVRLKKGGIWVSYKAKVKNGKSMFSVETPVGTIGIRGTVFAVKIDDKTGNAFVQVKEGIVEFKQDKTGKTVEIKGGQLLVIERDKNLRAPVNVGPDYDITAERLEGGGQKNDGGNNDGDGYQNTNPMEKLIQN